MCAGGESHVPFLFWKYLSVKQSSPCHPSARDKRFRQPQGYCGGELTQSSTDSPEGGEWL